MNRFLAPVAAGVLLSAVSFTASAEVVGFSTLQPGAINHLQAQIIGKVVQTHTDLQVRVIPVAGTTATLAAVQNKQAEFTIGDVNNMNDAIHAKGMFSKLNPMPDLRVVLKLTNFPIGFMVRKDSDMYKVSDLKGKRFPVGWQAFPNGIPLCTAILATAGMTFKDIVGFNVSGLMPQADDFAVGKTDVSCIAPPAPKVKEVDAKVGGIRWLEMDNSPEAVKAVKSVMPDYDIMTVSPPSPIVAIDKPTNFLLIHVLITAGTHTKDETVYKFAKAMFENKGELVKGHPIFNGFFPDKRAAQQFSGVKYHPGAIKLFKEMGIWAGS